MKKYLSILLVAVISISSVCIGNKISASESEVEAASNVEETHEEPLADIPNEEEVGSEDEGLVEEVPEEKTEEVQEDIQNENPENQETDDFSIDEQQPSNELEEQENLVQEEEQSIDGEGGLQTPAPTPEPPLTIDDIKQYFTWYDETAEVYTDDLSIEHMFYYYTGEERHPVLVMNNSVPQNIASAEIDYSFAEGITGEEVDKSAIANVGLWKVKATVTITDPITNEVLKVDTGKQREIIDPDSGEITYEKIIDVPTLTYIFEVKANIGNIIFDHELSFRYDGQPHVPTLTFYDDNNEVVENAEYTMTIYDYSGTMIVNKGELVEGQTLPTDKGEYRVHVDLAGDTANHYKINMLTDFHYSIEGKAKISFAGFDIGEEDTKEIVANGHKFVWKKDDSEFI